MRSEEIKTLADELVSPKWAIRIAAQVKLESVRSSRDWISLLTRIPSADQPVLGMICLRISSQMRMELVTEWAKIIDYVFNPASPLLKFETMIRDILEGFLASKRVSYRKKVEILTDILDKIAQKEFASDKLLIVLVRGLGVLRARRAIPNFEMLFERSQGVVLEVIRAIRQIQDRKAARYLEALFGAQDRRIAAAAVYAYGDMGHTGWWHLRRLRLLYDRSSSLVKSSLINVIPKCFPHLGARTLKKFYNSEQDPEIKYEILRRLGMIPGVVSGKTLLEAYASETLPKLRATASWSFNALPSLAMISAIASGLKSKDSRVQSLCLVKCGQLPPRMAKRLLAPFLQSPDRLEPVIKQTLIQSVASMRSDAPWLRQWLSAQLGKDPLSSLTAVSGLLRIPDPPLTETLKKSIPLGTSFLGDVLSFMADMPGLKVLSVLDRMIEFLNHSDPRIRLNASKILLNQKSKDLFQRVWHQAEKENVHDKEFSFPSLLGQVFSDEEASVSWIPEMPTSGAVDASAVSTSESSSTNETSEQTSLSLLKASCEAMKTTTWRLPQWRALISVLAQKHQSLSGSDRKEFENWIEILFEKYPHFWGTTVNDLLIHETESPSFQLVGMLAAKVPHSVQLRTLKELLARIIRGEGVQMGPILELLSTVRNAELAQDFLAWVVELPHGVVRVRALEALKNWLSEIPLEANNVELRERGVSFG